jgi:hypothetical protein
MEKQAADAERASIKYKQAEYLRDRIGQAFDGIISGLTNWGVYVELVENKCEGMIGLRDLPGDVYRFDQERYTVVGHRTGRSLRLGDELRVVIKAVDMDRRTVEFALEEDGGITTSGKFERRAPRGAPPKKGFRLPPKSKASAKGKSGSKAGGRKGKKRR